MTVMLSFNANLQSARSSAWSWNITADQTSVPSRSLILYSIPANVRAEGATASQSNDSLEGSDYGEGDATTARSCVYMGSREEWKATSIEGKVRIAVRGVRSLYDVPFEFVGEIASASAMAEASDIKGSTTAARHFRLFNDLFGTKC